MTTALTVTKHVHFRVSKGSRKVMREGKQTKRVLTQSIPRVSRLMALAIHMQKLVNMGEVTDYADLARLGHVSRARITQIMNLLHLAPDIQEEILFLPPTNGSRAPISERLIRPITAIPDWRKQRRMWREICGDNRHPSIHD